MSKIAVLLTGKNKKTYDTNEHYNRHSENVLLIAQMTEQPELIEEAQNIVNERNKIGHLSEDLHNRQKAILSRIKVFASFLLVLFFASCSTVQPQQQIEVIEEDESSAPAPINTPFTAVFVTNDCKHVRDTAVTFIFAPSDSLEITEDGMGYLIWTDKTGKIEIVTDKGIITSVTVYPSVDTDLFYQTFFASSKTKRYYESNPQLYRK